MSLLHCRQVRHNDEKAKGWSWRDSREPLVRRGLLSKRCGFLKLSVLLAFNAISQSSLFVPWPCFLIARNWNWDETWERGRWGLIIIIIIIKIIRLRSRHTTRIVMYIDYHQSSFNNISSGNKMMRNLIKTINSRFIIRRVVGMIILKLTRIDWQFTGNPSVHTQII